MDEIFDSFWINHDIENYPEQEYEYFLSKNQKLLIYNQYMEIIKKKHQPFISYISGYTGRSEEQIIVEIQTMIDDNYLRNYHIDIKKKLIAPMAGPKIDILPYLKYASLFLKCIPDYITFDSDNQKLDAYEIYKDLIRNKNITSIEEIANEIEKPINTVLLEIQKMIDELYLLDIHIDEKTKTIILNKGPKIDVYSIIKENLLIENQPEIKCPNCGAMNFKNSEFCEFCGSKLPIEY